jgi:hypothetical protein
VTPFTRVVGFAMLLSANGRGADHDWPAPPRAGDVDDRVSLSVSQRAGLASAPFVTPAFPEVSGFAIVLSGGAAVQISPAGWLRLRFPISFAWLDFPAGAQVPATALGNLELGLEHPIEVQRSTRVGLLAALLAPTAEHGSPMALLENRALAIASALTGGKDTALLTPGVTGLRLGARVEHSLSPFELRASLDVPLLVRISEASLPEGSATHSIGLLPALELDVAWWLAQGFGASLGGALVTEPLRVQEPIRERDREPRLQIVVELGLHARVGRSVALGLDATAPVGGLLGGGTGSIGAQGRFSF